MSVKTFCRDCPACEKVVDIYPVAGRCHHYAPKPGVYSYSVNWPPVPFDDTGFCFDAPVDTDAVHIMPAVDPERYTMTATEAVAQERGTED